MGPILSVVQGADSRLADASGSLSELLCLRTAVFTSRSDHKDPDSQGRFGALLLLCCTLLCRAGLAPLLVTVDHERRARDGQYDSDSAVDGGQGLIDDKRHHYGQDWRAGR